MSSCLHCNRIVSKNNKYCSNQCQADYAYIRFIDEWKLGRVNGDRGEKAKNISNHLRRYLHVKFEEKCARCGWNEINPQTGMSPLEIEHIDGNAENNLEENLTLLCPNCHSLTFSYKNLNKGNGRAWRRLKYTREISIK